MARKIIRESGSHEGDEGNNIFRILTEEAVTVDGKDGQNQIDLSTVHTTGKKVVLSGSVSGGITAINIQDVVGSASGDNVEGDDQDNTIHGLGGDDTLRGRGGDDTITGGQGDDFIQGNQGDDNIQGGVGDDTLQGNIGNDVLGGGDGSDVLIGGSGDDVLVGGTAGEYLPYQPRTHAKLQPKRRDVALFIFDDLTYSIAQFAKLGADVMPNMTKLIDEGFYFSKCYATSSICEPSRMSFLTGMMPEDTGVTGPMNNNDIAPEKFIQKHLQGNGFIVTEIGKVRRNTVESLGLDFEHHRAGQTFGAKARAVPQGGIDVDNRDELDTTFIDAQTSTIARSQIEQAGDKNHAWFFGITSPHGPYKYPQEYGDWVEENITDELILAFADTLDFEFGNDDYSNYPAHVRIGHNLGRNFGSFEEMAVDFRAYLAIARFGDAMMGEIKAALDKHRPDCLTIASSDHGYHTFDNGKGLGKGTLFANCLWTPLIFSGQGVPVGSYGEVVSLIDLVPTICEAVDIETPEHAVGLSLVDCLYSRTPIAAASIIDRSSSAGTDDIVFGGHTIVSGEGQIIRYIDGEEQNFGEHEGLNAYLPRWSDTLIGGAGNDKYIIGGGDTVIIDGVGFDEIHFTGAKSSIQTERKKDDLFVTHIGGTVLIENYFTRAGELAIIADDGEVSV